MIINSLSGGKTSSFLAMHYPADLDIFACVCLDDQRCAPKDAAIVAYAQSKLERFTPLYGDFVATAESDKTLRVMMDLEQLIGREILWVRGKSFDHVLNGSQTRLPSWARRYCTQQMKLDPMAEWVWLNSSDAINEMRIGFRADEMARVDRMRLNPDSGKHKFRTSYNLKTKKHKWTTVEYRKVSLPLADDYVLKRDVDAFWRGRALEFPEVSNCVGCFHKPARVINAQFGLEPEKMRWFAEQEGRAMGTWHDNKQTYAAISRLQFTGRLPLDHELYSTCDTGGCTD